LADEATVKQVASLYLDASLGLSSNGVDQPTSKERSFAAHQVIQQQHECQWAKDLK